MDYGKTKLLAVTLAKPLKTPPYCVHEACMVWLERYLTERLKGISIHLETPLPSKERLTDQSFLQKSASNYLFWSFHISWRPFVVDSLISVTDSGRGSAHHG
ncbi:hypothetical protein VTK56DRAFT_1336 [Thermocarpiscus australiensis]